MQRNDHVQITKINVAPDAEHATALWSEFKLGVRGKAPPVEYTVTGRLLNEPDLGACLWINRDDTDGNFRTSPLQKIAGAPQGLVLTTVNSVYLLTLVKPEGGA